MKLKKLTLKDVLAHESAEVPLGETLTVFTGCSDSGKSAVLRGLNQLLRNRPAGIDLLRHGAKRGGCSEVTLDGEHDGKPFTIARRRGKSKNEYELNGQQLLAFGQDVPVEVSTMLNLSTHAFQLQSDGNFMLCETDGQVAKMLSATVGLSQIDAAFTEVRKQKTANDTALACAETDEERERNALQRFAGLEDAEVALADAEALEARHAGILSLHADADKLAFRFAAVPRDTGDLIDGTERLLAEVTALREKWVGVGADADHAYTTLSELERLPEDASRRARSAKAALLGAEAANRRSTDANALLAAAAWLCRRLEEVPATVNIVLADKAISAYEALSARHLKAKTDLAEAVSGLHKLEALKPCTQTALITAAGEIQLFATADKLQAFIAEMVMNAETLLCELDRNDSAASNRTREIALIRKEIEEYKEQNKTCPECGAEQEHWTKGE